MDLGEAMWAAWVYLVDTAAHAGTPPDRQRTIASALLVQTREGQQPGGPARVRAAEAAPAALAIYIRT